MKGKKICYRCNHRSASGVCQAIEHFNEEDAATIMVDQETHCWGPEDVEFSAYLVTKPEFGCSLWEKDY